MGTLFGEQCKVLRRQGLSLPEICLLLKRAKGSVYFHIKNEPLSDARKKEIRVKKTKRLNCFIQEHRKGKSMYGRHPIPFTEWMPAHVFVIAHLLFDGRIARHHCEYYNRSETLVLEMQNTMCVLYVYPPKITPQETGVIRVTYSNVELATLIKEKSHELLEKISFMDVNLQRVFLQAFFDDEGCVSYEPEQNRRRVRGYQYKADVLFLVQTLLFQFGIRSIVYPKNNEVTINRHEDLLRFQKEINFSKGVCVNGERANSRWRESLEKREILVRALESYKTRKDTEHS